MKVARTQLIHTVRGRRGKRAGCQLVQSPCDGTPQVILGVGVEARKIWTASLEQSRDGGHRGALAQPFLRPCRNITFTIRNVL
jgi:hypothetical protein